MLPPWQGTSGATLSDESLVLLRHSPPNCKSQQNKVYREENKELNVTMSPVLQICCYVYLSVEAVLLVELWPVREGFLPKLAPLPDSSRRRPGRTLTVNGEKSVTQCGIKSLQITLVQH